MNIKVLPSIVVVVAMGVVTEIVCCPIMSAIKGYCPEMEAAPHHFGSVARGRPIVVNPAICTTIAEFGDGAHPTRLVGISLPESLEVKKGETSDESEEPQSFVHAIVNLVEDSNEFAKAIQAEDELSDTINRINASGRLSHSDLKGASK